MSDTRARRSAIAIQAQNLYSPAGVTSYDVDISLLAPDEQYEYLVAMIENIDAAYPAPYTMTPPYGEPIPTEEIASQAVIDMATDGPAASPQGYTDDELLPIISDAHDSTFPAPDWENDPQYYGLGVPPGVPNWNQPVETGHSQINLPNPAGENGWDEWSGKPKIARVARHENDFKGYNKGTSRGHMVNVWALQGKGSAVYFTQQRRDLLLSEIKKRGLHNLVVQDVPQVSHTDQVQWVDPSSYGANAPVIGEVGVL
jgi:hypothetical protein